MIKTILNRILKPEFVSIGSMVIKTSLIKSAYIDYEDNTIRLSIDDDFLDNELFTLKCDSKEHALETFKQAFNPFFKGRKL
ncbi:hypothetical protein [Psychrobacter sp. DAB_AL43B]|uniref:hypothetical protein n=1 Tax=Psychrobacter sp. DAB_AL43B TaxID=1028416 RepID=UPI0009A8F704|nr:hypothetical protein [Psychrobacter sp. DAB_AL43B]SLJ84485.1 hypothetical protein DABAL43B_1289 [Psychrobacter sp. DAB_AL43B]